MRTKSLREFINGLRAKQGKLVWPGTIMSARAIDGFIWKGSPDASLVQRIGLWLIGFVYLAFGLMLFGIAKRDKSFPIAIISLGTVLSGLKIFFNGFRGYRCRSKLP